MNYIKEKLATISDTRHSGYVEHNLTDVLIIILCAVLSGLDGLAEIAIYATNKASFFKEKFGIKSIPSKPTFSRILNMLDGDEIAKVIIEIMKERSELLGNIVAVDGKAIRSTSKKGHPHSALQILTAYITESGVVLGQKSIQEKTNEIPAFQEMLEFIDIKGKTITADAMHCQKETCKKIVAGGGNYVFGLKGNQKTLHDDVELFIKSESNSGSIDSFTTIEKLDVIFSEDDCKILSENGHKTLNTLRKLALMLHKQYISKQPKKISIKASLLNCLLDENYLCNILGSL